MHRFLRWAAILFVLIGAAGSVRASPSDQAQRMPVGPADAGAPAPFPVAAAPAPPPAPVAQPGPALAPHYAATVAPAFPQPQAMVPALVAQPGPALTPHYQAPVAAAIPQPQPTMPAANVNAARSAPVKGAPNSGHRRHLFHRRSADDSQQSARPGLFKRR